MSFISSLKNTFSQRPGLGGITKVVLCVFVLVGAATPVVNWTILEKDRWAPADYGYGPGKPAGVRPFAGLGYVPAVPAGASPQAGAKATGAAPKAAVDLSGGAFGDAFPWPLIPLHMTLLPDGRVLTYGTDQFGNQGGQTIYDIWYPTLGTGTNAHLTLPNYTTADTFCSAASVLASGNALVVGGDVTVNGVRNFSSSQVEIFNLRQNSLASAGQMAYPRWYPSITTLPNGDKLILGGRLLTATQGGLDVGPPTPELYSPTYGWRSLTGISIDPGEWYYPRGFTGPDGAVYLLQQNGKIFKLTTDYSGSMTDTGAWMDVSDGTQPSIWTMDKNGNPYVALMARWGGGAGEVQAVDFSQNPPVVSRVGDMHYQRSTGSFTLLPNGQVFANGGSVLFNDLATAVYQSEIYDPYSQQWYLAASSSYPRLYHNASLLLPDGTVLTGGGGAPGPVNELNGQIYYPPYLFRQDGSGLPATRPTIIWAPQALTLNQTFQLTVGANDQVGMIDLIRIGADTHDFNPEQRLIPVAFTQNGTQIAASLYAPPSLAPPGYYMLFVLNTAGVPAIAKIVFIGSGLPDLKPASLTYDSSSGLFHAVVTNQGTAPTPAGAFIGLSFYIDNGNWVSWGSLPGTLGPGQSVSIDSSQAGPYAIPPGTHWIGVYVDDYDQVVELDKNNNGLWQIVTIQGSTILPDLVPTSLSYNKTTGLFTVGVTNRGHAATHSGVAIGGAFYVDTWNNWVTWGAAPGPLAAGATVHFNSSGGGAYSIPSGTHWIGAWVDPRDHVYESNKNNNVTWATITVP